MERLGGEEFRKSISPHARHPSTSASPFFSQLLSRDGTRRLDQSPASKIKVWARAAAELQACPLLLFSSLSRSLSLAVSLSLSQPLYKPSLQAMDDSAGPGRAVDVLREWEV